MRTQAVSSRTLLALVTAGLLLPAPLAAQEAIDESALAADLQAIVDRLPDPSGDDAAGLRELLGPPDAFLIAFEPLGDGSSSRREQWIYYDLATAFELADGALLADRPLDAETGFLVLPGGHDPADFTAGATWASLAGVLDDPAAFEAVPLDEGYGIDATVYVGDFLQLAFDEDGGLFYVEAVPLSAGLRDGEPAS
jgi:hypothetical protein